MRVEITEADIVAGWAWSYWRLVQAKKPLLLESRCQHCPVAIAMKRASGKEVLAHTYRLTVGGKEYRTPEIVSDWMYDFDRDLKMKPFAFDLETE